MEATALHLNILMPVFKMPSLSLFPNSLNQDKGKNTFVYSGA